MSVDTVAGARTPVRSNPRDAAGSKNAAAIVIGLDSHTGLQTARILARRGVSVIGVAGDARHPCCRTRVCSEIVITDITSSQLIVTLQEIAGRLDSHAVLLPCTDLSVLLLSRQRHELAPGFHLMLPAAEVIEMLVDKASFSIWAERMGLPVPDTRVLRSAADVETAIPTLTFPCILKPSLRTTEWTRRACAKGFFVDDAAMLRSLFGRCHGWTESLIVQQYVRGGDTNHYTCNCYFTNAGDAAVSFTSRKLRQWPTTAGEGCLSEEVSNDHVRDATLRLLTLAGHRGPGYVEIKRDVDTGEYLILEANVGRPTGRSAQAEATGVELLYTQYCDALGLPLPAPRTRGTSVKWIYLRRDLQSAFHHWRRGDLTLGDWARSYEGPMVDALFSWSDPGPFLADLAYCAGKFLGSRRRKGDAAVAKETVSV